MGRVVLLLVLAAVGWVLFKVATGALSDARFVVKVGAQGATLRGAIPGKPDGDALEFIDNLQLPPGAKIWGVPDGGSLQLRFSDDVPDNLQQRIRNYVLN